MIHRRPPALADWLLDRLGDTRRHPAMAGDLLEEFRSGRSAAWYWRQTLVVIANGIAHSVVELWPYLLALGVAYAVQFVVALTLWLKSFPSAIPGSAWMKVSVWLLTQFAYGVCMALFDLLLVGKFDGNVRGRFGHNLKRMYRAVEPGGPRSAIMVLAGCESFSLGLASYCLCALIFPRFSLAALIGFEFVWFFLWVFAPAIMEPPAPPVEKAENVEVQRRSFAIPESEPVVTVTLTSGTEIVLVRESYAQAVFASADEDLIGVVFGRCRSLELLRRAIWLGGCRSQSYTLAEFAALIDEAAQKTNRRESFPLRVKLWFCGDSA